jgi:AraC family transcriptional regulator of adaptative response/methylated-DNA-[protein]-cysteine methyltransferase
VTRVTRFSTADERWAAVVGRNRQADGAFLYAVRTTGVYCRPACASRLPRRANVEFFDTCERAERKGYRACKKCAPRASDPQGIPAAVTLACRILDRADAALTLNELATAVGLSPFHFHRLFRRAVGVTPRAYAANARAERLHPNPPTPAPPSSAGCSPG